MRRRLPFTLVAALIIVGVLAPFITRPRPAVLPWDAPLTFGPQDIGAPYSDALAEIRHPAGPPPYPVVVILSGCAGITNNERDWSVRLASWGYAAALIDAFYHRHLKPLCDRTRIPIDLRARDAFNLAHYLATLPDFAGARMGVLGFSAGGQAALHAALEGSPFSAPFSAVVAYYPPCVLPAADSRFAVDTQVFVGSGDYPHIVRSCGEMAEALAGTPHAPRVKFYPGAQHIFDTPGGDVDAAADSFAMTKAFFDARLKRP
ncbi:MAG: dienelactone hydrolase family protein [Rhodospirillaceae bacterium]